MPTLAAVLPYLMQVVAFFNSEPLLILMVALGLELLSGTVRAAMEDRFTVRQALRGVVWKPLMYLSVFILLKLGHSYTQVHFEWAMVAFFLKEIVSVLFNWKAIALLNEDPSERVVDALIHFFSLDKLLKIPTK